MGTAGMRKRKTFELDEVLLERARRALGGKAMHATVERALRCAVDRAEAEQDRRAGAQIGYLADLASVADLDVMAGVDAWR